MSYTHEYVKEMYETLRRDSDTWEDIAGDWKARAEAALKVLEGLEWIPSFSAAAGSFYQCPECHAYKDGGHQGDCALAAALTTGRRRRQEAPSEGERWPPGANVGPRVGIPSEEYETLAKAGGCRSEAETVVSWSSYDELLTSYLKLARERVLVNVLCIVSGLVALVVLAVQVYNVLGQGS